MDLTYKEFIEVACQIMELPLVDHQWGAPLDVGGYFCQREVAVIVCNRNHEAIRAKHNVCPFLIVAHELVHYRQFREKKLIIDLNNGDRIWEGKVYTFQEVQESEHDSLPWEIEAKAQQQELYDMIMSKINERKAA